MRVLFSSTAGHGHVYPLVPLARAFTDAGHNVLWAGHASVGSLVAEAGLAAVPAGLQGARFTAVIDDLRRRARELPPAQRAAFTFPNGFGSALTPSMAVDLLGLAREWHPDLLVHEQAELASPLVGVVMGIPSVMQSYGGAVPSDFISEAGERLAPLWRQYGLTIPAYAGCFAAPFVDICPPSIRPVSLDHVPVVHQLRPVIYSGLERQDLVVPAGSDPLVYLTLGTIPGTTATLAAMLNALAALPIRVIATVGPEGDPSVLGKQPAHVTVSRYAPQTQVLPLCDAVVSHAGSGTFLGALAHGLPQLCLPQAADQFRNAEACVRAGAGKVIHPEVATSEAITDAVTTLFSDEIFRANASRIRSEIDAMPPARDVVALLQALANS